MTTRRARTTLGIVTLLVLVPAAVARAGDWLGWRRDAQRTALASGSSDLHKPALRWRYYVGGTLAASQYLAADVNGDGLNEVIYVAGGKTVAKHPNDLLLWETAPLKINLLKGLFDLDGDGKSELLAAGLGGKVYVLDPRTGKVLWELADGAHTHVGALLVGDLDGDKKLDLYLAETACGASETKLFQSDAYSFAAGYGAAKQLWISPYAPDRTYNCGRSDLLADIDNDGELEIIALDTDAIHVYSGKTGKHKYETTKVGSIPYGIATTAVVDVDGKAPPELVFLTNNSYGITINSRRAWVMGFDPTQKKLVTRWQHAVPDVENDVHRFEDNSAGDLDGDGRAELVTSFQEGGKWTTTIYDAAAVGSEVVLATIADEYLAGLADVDDDGKIEIITYRPANAELRIRDYEKGAFGSQFFALKGVSLASLLDRDRSTRQYGATRTLTWDANGDGHPELIGVASVGGVYELRAYELRNQTLPKLVASFPLDPDVTFKAYQPFSDVGVKGPQLLVPRTDGYLVVLASGLLPTNEQKTDEFRTKGMRIGGFNGALPVVADLDGNKQRAVLAIDSRSRLVRIDPAGANLAKPPARVWEVPTSIAPAAADLDGDGKLEVLVGSGSTVYAYRSDGTKLWSRAVTGALRGSLIAGDLTGDGAPEVIYTAFNGAGGFEQVNALDGKKGTPLWAADYSRLVAGCGFGYQTLLDLDGDNLLDVFVAPGGLVVGLKGTDGALLASASNSSCTAGYGLVLDLDGDGKKEVVATGTAKGIRAFEPTWSGTALTLPTKWSVDESSWFTGVLTTAVTCQGAARIVGAEYTSSEIRVRDGASGATLHTIALVEGAAYADEQKAIAAGKRPGYLSSASAHADLAGDGQPRVVVGSSDGYLYAIEPCKGTLDWSLNLRAPVSEPVFGDTDGDGKDEILVASEDGFLYAIGREHLPAPAFVYENAGNGPAASAAEDLDELETSNTLFANWAAVPGADAYEYAVLTAGGTFVSSPEFISAGALTSVKAGGLKLKEGQRYFFAVRALDLKSGKTSGETISDGVLIVDKEAPKIALTVTPDAFDPKQNESCSIEAQLSDRRSLASYRIWIEDAAGKTVKDHGEQKVQGVAANASLTWDGKDPAGAALAYGSYTVRATAEDLAAHKGEASAKLELREQTVPPPPGPGSETSSGCSCRVASPPSAGGAALMMLALLASALLLRRRRARRR